MGSSFHISRGVRIDKIAPAWRGRSDRVAAFCCTFSPGEHPDSILKTEGNSLVMRVCIDGHAAIVKLHQMSRLRDRAKSLLRATKGFRQWRGARRLLRAGIPVSRPIALVTRGRSHEWLILEEVAGKTLLRHLADRDLTIRDQHAVARAVGVQVGAMLRANVCNRDHKPSNLIVTFDEGVPIVTLIDTVGIRRRGNPGEMARMLATLLIEPIGVGVAPRGVIAYRVLRDACAAWLEHALARPLGSAKGDKKALRALVRSMARRVDQYIQTHGDPTPKVHPLV